MIRLIHMKFFIGIVAVLVGVIACGYFYYSSIIATEDPDFAAEQFRAESLKKVDSSVPETQKKEAPVSVVFDVAKIKLGDKVGTFTVSKIDANWVTFSGNQKFTGGFGYSLGGFNDYYLNMSDSDKNLLPRQAGDSVKAVLAIGSVGSLPEGYVPRDNEASIRAEVEVVRYMYPRNVNPHVVPSADISTVRATEQ